MPELILLFLGSGGGAAWYGWTGYVKRTKPCRACAGYGYTERAGIIGRHPRICKKCGGNGMVLRLAARRVQRSRAGRARRATQARQGARSMRAASW